MFNQNNTNLILATEEKKNYELYSSLLGLNAYKDNLLNVQKNDCLYVYIKTKVFEKEHRLKITYKSTDNVVFSLDDLKKNFELFLLNKFACFFSRNTLFYSINFLCKREDNVLWKYTKIPLFDITGKCVEISNTNALGLRIHYKNSNQKQKITLNGVCKIHKLFRNDLTNLENSDLLIHLKQITDGLKEPFYIKDVLFVVNGFNNKNIGPVDYIVPLNLV